MPNREELIVSLELRSTIIRTMNTFRVQSRAVFKGEGFTSSNPPPNYDEKNLICPSVRLFHISVQWSFNVDQFMQTFDS